MGVFVRVGRWSCVAANHHHNVNFHTTPKQPTTKQTTKKAIPFVDDLAAAFGDFSCRRTAGGRQLTLAVGGRRLSYGPQTYMLDLGGTGGRCASAFQPLAGLGDDEWLIGMQMLAPVYTAYDYGVAAASSGGGSGSVRRAGGKRRVGFARLAPELEVEAFLTSDLPKFPPPGAATAAAAAAAAARLRPEGAASRGATVEGSSPSVAAAKPAAASSGSGGGRVLGSTMLRGAAATVALLLLLIV
jgi:hypothetical protein